MARTVRALKSTPATAAVGLEGPSVVSLSPPKRRRPSWVLLGVLMVGLAALVGAYVLVIVTDTVQVMVAAGDLAPGEPIDPSDLRVVEMGRTAELRAIQPADQGLIVGLAPVGPVPAGTVLNMGLFVPLAETVPPGQVVVGASFDAGSVPTASLGPGDVVGLLAAVDTGSGTASSVGSAAPVEAAVLGEATVFAVQAAVSPQSSSGRVWVSLLVDEELQAAVVQAAADDRLRLSLTARSSE